MHPLLKRFIPQGKVEYAMLAFIGAITAISAVSYEAGRSDESRLEREAQTQPTRDSFLALAPHLCTDPQQDKGYFSLHLSEGETEAFCNVDCKDLREGRQPLIVCYRQQPATPETLQ